MIGTLFLLPLFTCVLATAAIRRDIRRGSLERLDAAPTHRRLAALPAGRWRRGAAFGGLAVVVLAPPRPPPRSSVPRLSGQFVPGRPLRRRARHARHPRSPCRDGRP